MVEYVGAWSREQTATLGRRTYNLCTVVVLPRKRFLALFADWFSTVMHV